MPIKKYIPILRPHQWVKNLFLFLPLVFGQKLFDTSVFFRTVGAFCFFSLAASIAYIINDIIDRKKDAHHPLKRNRPIVAGVISLREAGLLALGLAIISFSGAYMIGSLFLGVVACYIIFNVVYSAALKNVVIVDVFCLAGFFLLRLLAGSVVADVALSHWIILMTGLLALFLGFIKRRQELFHLQDNAQEHRSALGSYTTYFIDQMITIITASIVVVFMLYTVDARTVGEVGSIHLIYSIPFVYYGIFRYLYLIHACNEDGDPTRILVSDKKLQVSIVLWVAVCIAIIYLGV